ncbi:MAG: class I SAM-dependent methyltransferase [Desulfobulbaceae bacterium]|nr:class I SAM-dependent methyltransferase [Desulfobulbaceae bacterium]
MRTRKDISQDTVVSHFTARAYKYDASSKWCTDDDMLKTIVQCLAPAPDASVLDIACGTGLISRQFHKQVKQLIGVDITDAMFHKAKPLTDGLVKASAEVLPFKEGSFDIALERQGIQFMEAEEAVKEMARVTKPRGKVCLIQLCAYGTEDQEEYFEILRLRNPARRNFFMREDLANLLTAAGCVDVKVMDFISDEDVDRWADNGAIEDERRQKIHDIYRKATPGFNQYHAVTIAADGRIVDKMLFGIAIGTIPA